MDTGPDLQVAGKMPTVGVPLISQLLRALPPSASLLLARDVDHLPSVGPGMVLRHIIESAVGPGARLSGYPKAKLVILGDFNEGHPVGSDG